jgi:hypothetical protein
MNVLSFREFITEKYDQSADKLKHLEHAEDYFIHAGRAGYEHARRVLHGVHDKLTGKDSKTNVTTKFDGSPSVVWGHHPDTGKFFVASKSAFNKNPKINYTHEDIEKHHGHAPGLVEKLKAAHEHLQKITPSTGVYQGDVMYSHNDKIHHKDKISFTPNTLTYKVPKHSDTGKKIARSKFGIATHTKYEGSNFENMKAGFNPDHHNFKSHPDVHNINPAIDHTKLHYSDDHRKTFIAHMKMADKLHTTKADSHFYDAIEPHTEHLKTYINQTVRHGTEPTTVGYKQHIHDKFNKEIDKVSTPKAKEQKTQIRNQHLTHVDRNAAHFNTALKLHSHIQKAKNSLVDALSSNHEFEHSINGVAAKPEGFVAVHEGKPIKLVNRHEFSRANFAKNN